MQSGPRRALALMAIGALAGTLITGCASSTTSKTSDNATRSVEVTLGEFPEAGPPSPAVPPPPMMRRPESAVYSYLLWISYAYRVQNSDVASPTYSPFEEVHVDSYVEYNKEHSRAIDQRLMDLQLKKVRTVGETSTISARERWLYRYIKYPQGGYDGPVHSVSYDTTYTLVKYPNQGWLVDDVKASAVGKKPE